MIQKLLLVLLILFLASDTLEQKPELPKCQHVNPKNHLVDWLQLEERPCNHTTNVTGLTDEERKRYDWGIRSFAFDAFASENLGPRRDVGDQSHELCEKEVYDADFPTSIVIIHHNEAISVLVRMLNGIFSKTPANLLKEVILYEDASEEDHQLTQLLENYVEFNSDVVGTKIRIHRSEQRLGLIKAKVMASRLATGEVIVFLDSHCEVANNWLPPLLQPIKEDEKSVVLPIVDLINPVTFEFSKSMIAKSGFDWSLTFKWIYIPWEYFEKEENNVKPFESPAMSGGLLAIKTDYFRALGEYDDGMEIWGAENIELSLKTWMCGGRVLVAPCSRIGHVFRMRRPYTSKPGIDTNLYNSIRVAKTWLGPYEKLFFETRPKAVNMSYGDLSSAAKVRESLDCKDMEWFIENVYPELKPRKRDEL